MFHLEGRLLNLLVAVVLNVFNLFTAVGISLYAKSCFNEYPYIMISMDNFFNKSVFKLEPRTFIIEVFMLVL